jgi:hypothetical protein
MHPHRSGMKRTCAASGPIHLVLLRAGPCHRAPSDARLRWPGEAPPDPHVSVAHRAANRTLTVADGADCLRDLLTSVRSRIRRLD